MLLLLLVVGPVLLLAWHRPLHPLSCPVAFVDVCRAAAAVAAAAATVYSSVGISCSGTRRLHSGSHRIIALQMVKGLEDRTARSTVFIA